MIFHRLWYSYSPRCVSARYFSSKEHSLMRVVSRSSYSRLFHRARWTSERKPRAAESKKTNRWNWETPITRVLLIRPWCSRVFGNGYDWSYRLARTISRLQKLQGTQQSLNYQDYFTSCSSRLELIKSIVVVKDHVASTKINKSALPREESSATEKFERRKKVRKIWNHWTTRFPSFDVKGSTGWPSPSGGSRRFEKRWTPWRTVGEIIAQLYARHELIQQFKNFVSWHVLTETNPLGS